MNFTKAKGILSSKNGMYLFKISNGSAAKKRRNELERRVESKQQRELEKKRKFQLKQEKRKQKHRGK